ncbi:hypothetical protein FRC08_001162 [Ceratobasidium sp. 394]|nr:hypothetical protein FRC08_001162 [Ceratobasidium sp. 394]
MANKFWGYPAPDAHLIATAKSYNLRFANNPGHTCSGPMADLMFDRLEVYGPLCVMCGAINNDFGMVFVLGRDNDPLESIPKELIENAEQTFGYPIRLFTWDKQKQKYTTERLGAPNEVDTLWRGTLQRSNLRSYKPRKPT